MTVRPEFGPDYGQEQWEPPEPSSKLRADEEREVDEGERELSEHAEEEQELDYLDPEDNELHAPGQVCERCGTVITALQEARRRPDGQWVHEVCPVHPS